MGIRRDTAATPPEGGAPLGLGRKARSETAPGRRVQLTGSQACRNCEVGRKARGHGTGGIIRAEPKRARISDVSLGY
jgi:hypothetical protein